VQVSATAQSGSDSQRGDDTGASVSVVGDGPVLGQPDTHGQRRWPPGLEEARMKDEPKFRDLWPSRFQARTHT